MATKKKEAIKENTKNSKVFDVKDFINEYLVKQIGEIIKKDHPYLASILICSGLEFLGKCLNENKKWGYKGKSMSDIKNAITLLMPKKYHSLNIESELCEKMIHCMSPGKTLSLGYINHGCKKHLKKNSLKPLRTIIEVSEFHKDFVLACNKVIKKIEKHYFKPGNKVYQSFLFVG